MLRESLTRSAREASRWRAHNLACAEMLKSLGGANHRVVADRRAEHLHAANMLDQATDAFLVAAKHRHRSGEPGQALRLLARREHVMKRQALPTSDPRWAQGWVLAANAALRSGDFMTAQTLATQAVVASAETGDTRTRAEALDSLAFVARREGDLDSALRHSEAALALHDRLNDPRGRASALLNLGHTHMERGAIEPASELFAQARELFADEQDDAGVGRSVLAMGHAAARCEQTDDARALYERARELFELVGNSFLVLACDSGIARLTESSAKSSTKTPDAAPAASPEPTSA
jgi:tetratricopeptide (TPR) repeat protein